MRYSHHSAGLQITLREGAKAGYPVLVGKVIYECEAGDSPLAAAGCDCGRRRRHGGRQAIAHDAVRAESPVAGRGTTSGDAVVPAVGKKDGADPSGRSLAGRRTQALEELGRAEERV